MNRTTLCTEPKEKITLAGNTCATISIGLFIISSLTSVGMLYLFAKTAGINSTLLFSTACLAALHIALAYQIYRNIASAYISGEMLIVRYLFGRSKVTEIRSLSSTKSFRILFLRFTMLKFKLDGRKYSILTFGIPYMSEDPLDILRDLRKAA